MSSVSVSPPSTAPSFPGEMAALVRSHDWSKTPLGPAERWPQSLRLIVDVILASGFPMAVRWGPDFVLIYNDGYQPILGDKHPRALGLPFRDAWPEVQQRLGPLHEEILAGENPGLFSEDLPLTIRRRGEAWEEARFTVSYSPIADPTAPSGVGGILVTAVETTGRVQTEIALREAETALRRSNAELQDEREAVKAVNRRLLAESEDLRRLFEQAPGFMAVVTGPNHVFTLANASYAKLVGNREVLGKSVRDALPEVAGQGFIDLLDRVHRTGQPYVGRGVRARLQQTPGGPADERSLDFVYQPITTDDGTVTGIFVQGHDLTELMRAEEALKESEARFRLVAESAPVMLWMGDSTGKCVYLNEAQREFWGVRSEDVTSFNWGTTLLSEDQPKLYEPFNRAMQAYTPFTVEARYRRRDGSIRLLRTDGRPRFDSRGEFVGMIGVNVDITESRRAELALRDETSALEVLNRTGAAIAGELDLERVVQAVTDAGVQLTGAQFGAFFYNVLNEQGESYMLYTLSGVSRDAFAQYPMPRATKVFEPTFKGEGIVRSDDITKDRRYGHNDPHYGMPKGHLPVRSYLAVPVRSRSGEVLGGMFFGHPEPAMFTERAERMMIGLAGQASIAIDNARLFQEAQRELEQRRLAEEALQHLNATLEQQVVERTAQLRTQEEELRQAQKMEAVGQLTGGVAHDFNNLLQVIVGNLETLQRNLPADSGRLRRATDHAMNGARRAATLTQRLLAFSRRQPLEPKPIKVNDLVTGMSELLHRSLGETIAVETVLAAGVWRTEADPNQLESALLNLAVNARDAMPSGGKLTIETANTRIDEGYAATQAEVAPGQYIVICVSDTGVGMDKATIARVFEPFFTTKEPGKGTGLGLSQVYGFVKQSGGHVKVYSEPGEGSTVKIYLPRLLGAESEDDIVAEAIAPEGTRAETILVVEDDDDVRAYSVDILRELGYRVVEAHDGPSALRLLERQPKVDLLFSDVVLPGGWTGAQTAARARAQRPGLKVLFTTGYARNAIVHHGRLDAGVQLITKPFTYAELAAKVRDVLDLP
jgi:PAS domain S-box-containing protein